MAKHTLSCGLRCILGLERVSLPLWRMALRKRLAGGKETPASIDQKLMLRLPASHALLPAGAPVVWGHAVGVGEVLGLLGLFRRLAEHMPGHHFLLTSSSRTSGQALAQQLLPANFHHQFAPIDHPKVLARFFDAWQPHLACWSETDLWPGMVLATRRRGIPMLMFNTRIDAAKCARIQRLRWFYLPLLAAFTRLYPQNLPSEDHLKALGFAKTLASAMGNIKALAPPLHAQHSQLASFQAAWQERLVWVLASSHMHEEEIALKAHREILKSHPRAVLIIVPRDAFRGTEIVAISQSHALKTVARSQSAKAVSDCQVYVADTMGELGLWYALSSVAVVGGSLVPVGGHNPYEALAAGCRVLSGPHVHHFSESYAELQENGLAQTVREEKDIVQGVTHLSKLARLTSMNHPPAQALLDDILAQIRQADTPSQAPSKVNGA